MKGTVVLSHGLESGPAATKVSAMAEVAESMGWHSLRPDYRPFAEVSDRLQHLLHCCASQPGPLLLAGSSLGALISALAAPSVRPLGLYLLAPPVAVASLPDVALPDCPVAIVHGWRDELIAAEAVIALAGRHRAELLLTDDGHRLADSLPVLLAHFRSFLQRVALP